MNNRFFPTLTMVFLSAAVCYADLPQAGDVVFGLSRPDPVQTMEIVRGPTVMGGGAVVPDPWNDQNFVQSVEFDNLGGLAHNYQGNLLAANFGSSASGGVIYNFATTAEISTPQVIGDFAGGIGNLGGSNVTQTRISSISVSPANTKISVFGNDTGTVLVYDYTAGDTMGGGASLANARETSLFGLPTGATQATAWLDDNTVLTLTRDGLLKSVNATTMAISDVTSVPSPIGVGTSDYTSLLYNPEISQYLFGMISTFDGATMISQTNMFVFDPSNSFSLENTIDLSGSSDTGREMAFDADGNLFLSQFGANIGYIPNAATMGPTLGDDSLINWYTSTVGAASSFNGIDIGLGGETIIDGDFDNNGLWNCNDINMLTAVTAAMSNDLNFDLNGDNLVNDADITAWLAEGGAMNPVQTGGNPFLRGDSNLDGEVDGQDFIDWNTNKFTSNSAWCDGNFNGDADIDGQDFIAWNTNKFMSSDAASAVPEPSISLLVLCSLAGLTHVGRQRHKSAPNKIRLETRARVSRLRPGTHCNGGCAVTTRS